MNTAPRHTSSTRLLDIHGTNWQPKFRADQAALALQKKLITYARNDANRASIYCTTGHADIVNEALHARTESCPVTSTYRNSTRPPFFPNHGSP